MTTRRFNGAQSTVRIFSALILAGSALSSLNAQAQDCGPRQFDNLVDKTGETLRAQNEQSERLLEGDLEKLAKLKEWKGEQATERGFAFLQDDQTRTLDQQASELLIRLDLLSDTETKPATCERLDELKQATAQLLEVTAAKSAHIRAKLSVALNPKLTAQRKSTGAAGSKASKSNLRPSAFPKPKVPNKKSVVGKQAARTASPKPPPRRAAPNGRATAKWATTTTAAPPPSPEIMAALPPVTVEQVDVTYSADEIRAAGRGVFGSISAELAAVIKYAFDSYGNPNGYVLGTEAGAAFLAGLRYGHGKLASKQYPARKIYWQGPSIGTDFGITGSRVMMLVYNLDQQSAIFKRFVGVEGAAYLVGGVGITFHKQGNIVLAPIRTGLGLRLGANVGYLKITPKRQFNPF